MQSLSANVQLFTNKPVGFGNLDAKISVYGTNMHFSKYQKNKKEKHRT
jgi:hypothetical protein